MDKKIKQKIEFYKIACKDGFIIPNL